MYFDTDRFRCVSIICNFAWKPKDELCELYVLLYALDSYSSMYAEWLMVPSGVSMECMFCFLQSVYPRLVALYYNRCLPVDHPLFIDAYFNARPYSHHPDIDTIPAR